MNNDKQRLRHLVDAYRLSRPVSPELQRIAIKSRKPDLRRILKKSGRYGLLSWLVIMIFMLFRKYGLQVTMLQSKIIAGITAAAVASGSAAGTYKGVKYIIEAAIRPAPHADETLDVPETKNIEHRDTTAPSAPVELQRAVEKQSVPAYKGKSAPVENKLPESGNAEKAKKKTDPEHDSISDIPSL